MSDNTKLALTNRNVFHALRKRDSKLLDLFNLNNSELLSLGVQAPSPSKDYCQIVLTYDKIIYRCWKITLRADSNAIYPSETKDTYEEFINDEKMQRDIARVFGRAALFYIQNIIENGKLDYLARLPEPLLLRVVSFLDLEDIARLSQVNSLFRKLCRSDRVWMDLYRKYYSSEITHELTRLAERDGWRKLFFTNKIKLQLELRRQSKKTDAAKGHETASSVVQMRNLKNSSAHTIEPSKQYSKLRVKSFLFEN